MGALCDLDKIDKTTKCKMASYIFLCITLPLAFLIVPIVIGTLGIQNKLLIPFGVSVFLIVLGITSAVSCVSLLCRYCTKDSNVPVFPCCCPDCT